ncbi:S8 family serine peptidase [Thomasclavelia cocleata]|uniref:S8 family serine peptidase n=1 Tax=Thomasclavelia cocleata TaxID=69824 RepID=UPI00242A6639|nr:S8 family serine peptidase [Thomasclavelia cocleata]
MANIIGSLSFVSSKQRIIVKLKGVNSVSVKFGTETENYNLSKNEIVVEHDFGNTDSHYIVINNAQNITEIDISNNGINNINLYLCTLLKKFVAYNNNINKLEFTNSNALQYVHIQNNPMCTNESAMTNMINSLPDRNNKAFGSIIMYDFVPPREFENMTMDQLYERDVRKKLEKTSIPKDWYFGSAIIYNEEEYAKCMNIKESHVTDVWESAEYGEGLVVSSKENGYALNHPEIESNRILEHKQFNTATNPTSLIDKTNASIAQGDFQSHGTKTLSVIGASNKIYGVLPRCKFKLLDAINNDSYKTDAYFNLIRDFYDDTIDIIYLAQSFTNSELAAKIAASLSNNKKRLVISSVGNDGDGALNTDDHTLTEYPGSHLIEDGGFMHYVAGLGNNNTIYQISTWCQGVDVAERAFGYAPEFSNSTKNFIYRYFNGTSYSAPLVAGYAGIIQVLLTKKHGKKPTKDEVIDEIVRRCNPLKQYHRYKIGNGRIDFSTYNTMESFDILAESIQAEESVTMDLYSKYKLKYKLLPDNIYNNNITIESTDNNIVQISEDNTLFALSVGSCEVVVFSNDGSIKKNIPITVNSITEAKIEEENTSMVGKFERENFTPNGEWINSIEGSNIKLNTVDIDNNLNITSVNGYLEIPHIQTDFTVSFYVGNIIDLKYNGRIFSLYNYNEDEFFTLDFMATVKDNNLMLVGLLERDINGKSDYTKQYYNQFPNIKNAFNQNNITCVFNKGVQQIIIYLDGNKILEEYLTDRMPNNLKICIGNSKMHNKAVVGANFSEVRVFSKALSNDEVLDNVARQLKINNNITEIEGDEGKVEYKGSVTLISGLRQANNGKFPLVDATAVQYKNEENEDGTFKSVEQKIDEIAGDNSKFATSEDVDNIISDLFG